MNLRLIIFLASTLLIIFSCRDKINNSNQTSSALLDELPEFNIDTIIDLRDNKKYATIKIGSQTWIKGVIKYNATKGRIYRGYLYDWDAATNACLSSYNIPSEKDWSILFQYVSDSIIKRCSPKLIKSVFDNNTHCAECSKYATRPHMFQIDSAIHRLGDYDFSKMQNNQGHTKDIISIFLDKIGFCTYGSGFKYNRGMGVDDYSYFWTSSSDNSKDYKYINLYTGEFCGGCGYMFSMPYNNNFGFNLKCVRYNR